MSAAAQRTPRKRLPPFGRELLEMRRSGLVPADNQVIIALDSWDYAKTRARVVIPPELDPDVCDLAFVAALDVVIICDRARTTTIRRDALVRAVLRCNPITLRVLAMGDPVEWTWIKSRAVGIELEEFR